MIIAAVIAALLVPSASAISQPLDLKAGPAPEFEKKKASRPDCCGRAPLSVPIQWRWHWPLLGRSAIELPITRSSQQPKRVIYGTDKTSKRRAQPEAESLKVRTSTQ